MHRAAFASPQTAAPDPRVLRPVRQIALAGLALVLVWPAARGHSEWLGWWPLWLVGMPMVAWWALYRFRLPARARRQEGARARRRRMPQACRRPARGPGAGPRGLIPSKVALPARGGARAVC